MPSSSRASSANDPPPKLVKVKEREARNPILAEKTPRTHYQNSKWKYDIPKGKAPLQRWNEVEEEDSIVSMFGSVQQKVAEEKERERQYKERIRKFEESQKAGGAMPSSRSARESARPSARSETQRSETHRATGRTELATDRTYMSETGRTGRSTARDMDANLVNMPVAAMMTLQPDHPEILAKMRAERAAKFVGSLRDPLHPPEKASMSSRGCFRPGGSLTHTEAVLSGSHGKTKKKGQSSTKTGGSSSQQATIVVSARDVDTARMKESLHSLVAALDETDQQIARQNLKIALSKKVKTFDKKSK